MEDGIETFYGSIQTGSGTHRERNNMTRRIKRAVKTITRKKQNFPYLHSRRSTHRTWAPSRPGRHRSLYRSTRWSGAPADTGGCTGRWGECSGWCHWVVCSCGRRGLSSASGGKKHRCDDDEGEKSGGKSIDIATLGMKSLEGRIQPSDLLFYIFSGLSPHKNL